MSDATDVAAPSIQSSAELQALLTKWKLNPQQLAPVLSAKAVVTPQDLSKLKEDDVKEILSIKELMKFREMCAAEKALLPKVTPPKVCLLCIILAMC